MPLGTLLRILWRRRLLIVLVGAGIGSLVVAASLAVAPLYEAKALLVVDKSPKALRFQPDDSAKGGEFNLLNTQRDLLLSYPVLGAVIDQVGLRDTPAYANSSDPMDQLRRRISVGTNKDSWVINLALRDEDPERATNALSALISAHLANEALRYADRSRNAILFLKGQVEQARQTLEARRAEERELRSAKGILSTDPERNHLALELAAYQASRVPLAADISASSAVMRSLADCDERPEGPERIDALLRVPGIRRDPLVLRCQEDLLGMQDRVASLTQRYKPAHPIMREAEEQLAAARSRLAVAVESTRAALVQDDRTLARRMERLDRDIGERETHLSAYRDLLIDLQIKSEETASAERLFQTLLVRLQEEEVSSHLGERSVAVAEPAHVASAPVNIRRSLFLLAALVLGGGGGVAVALIAELLDRRIRDTGSLREFADLPTLCVIPHCDGLGPPGNGLPTPALRAVDEAFRVLRSTIQLSHDVELGSRIILVASPGGSDGRTTVAARLAHSLAASGRQVLLVDGDLRNPALHVQMGLPPGKGLGEILSGGEQVAPSATPFPRLSLLRAGEVGEDAVESLQGNVFYNLLSDATSSHHYIILDSPSLEFSEALVFGSVADQILLVIRDRHTAKESLRMAESRLGQLRGKITGLVINDDHEVPAAGMVRDFRTPRPDGATSTFRRSDAAR